MYILSFSEVLTIFLSFSFFGIKIQIHVYFHLNCPGNLRSTRNTKGHMQVKSIFWEDMSKITEIRHFSHKHQLKLMCVKKSNYQCAGCKEPGLGSCYQCNKKKCGFHLHEECALASGSGSITHPFFKNCHFIFHDDESQSELH